MSNSKLYTGDVKYLNRLLDLLRANFRIFTLKKYQLANSTPPMFLSTISQDSLWAWRQSEIKQYRHEPLHHHFQTLDKWCETVFKISGFLKFK